MWRGHWQIAKQLVNGGIGQNWFDCQQFRPLAPAGEEVGGVLLRGEAGGVDSGLWRDAEIIKMGRRHKGGTAVLTACSRVSLSV